MIDWSLEQNKIIVTTMIISWIMIFLSQYIFIRSHVDIIIILIFFVLIFILSFWTGCFLITEYLKK